MANFQFLRIVPVNLMRYLPQFLAKDKHFSAIQNALSAEHEKQRQLAIDLEKQFFVDTATWGLDDWERFVGIEVNRSIDYESRRKKIKLYLYPEISSTEKYLESLANDYLYDNSADIIPHNEEYWFELTFNIDGLISLTDLKYAINLYKPAHLGFLIAFKIISQVNIKHKAAIIQYIDALHNSWNLGTAETTHWDGTYCFDGTIDFSGIKPDSKYKDRQSHLADITGIVTPQYMQNITHLVWTKAVINSKYKQLSGHKAAIIQYIDALHRYTPAYSLTEVIRVNAPQVFKIGGQSKTTAVIKSNQKNDIKYEVSSSSIADFKHKKKIECASNNTSKSSSIQNRAGYMRNVWDGSFIMDGSHCFDGSYTDTNICENACAIATLDAQGNVKEGSWQTA